jgi:hypothetical protein
LIEIGLLVMEKKILKILSVFLLFRYYLPLEYGVALDMNNSESPLRKDDCANFGYNWPSGSGEEFENVKV